MSASASTCLRCECGLSDARLEGLCPACLLAAGLLAAEVVEPSTVKLPKIDGYDLIEQIGVGGMGVVYKAQQLGPIKRLVAIKLIKLGMDTQELITRFEGERQALAQLNHPNVAAAYHADATAAGRPFFVMEYVPGEPITTFCDRHRYDTRQRLELFIQACEGIQHAHQKAIIHRDVKPSNLLVTLDAAGKPLVKVIDFGVAKATTQRLTEQTMFTAHGQLIGTPEYMSPEQAQSSGSDVDTRSDIYSLGVVLYELLSGALPFEPQTLRGATFGEIQRIIREVDPPRPSTRLSSAADAAAIAIRRHTHAPALARELRRELEWIPLKAIRKEPALRYAAATELAKDVQNYLAGRPLMAGPESARYRAAKFVRRNKARVMVAATIGLLVLASVTVSSWQAVRLHAEQQRTLAEKQETERRRRQAVAAEAATREVNRFLTDMLAAVDPNRAQGKPVLVSDVLEASSRNLDERFAKQPVVERQLRITIGQTLISLGKTDRALPHLERVIVLTARLYGENSRYTFAARRDVARNLYHLKRPAEAERMLLALVAEAPTTPGVGRRDILAVQELLAYTQKALGQHAAAEQSLRRLLQTARELEDPDSTGTAHTLAALGSMIGGRGNAVEGEAMLREALAMQRRLLHADHTDLLWTLAAYGGLLSAMGRDAEAEPLLREAVERDRRVVGEPDSLTHWAVEALGGLMLKQGRFEEAEPLLRTHYDALCARYGPAYGHALSCGDQLTKALRGLGRYNDAAAIDEKLLLRRRETLGERHPETIKSLHALAVDRIGAGNSADAEAALLHYRRTLLADGRNTSAEMRWALHSLAKVYDATTRPARAARARAELAAIAPTPRATTQQAFPTTLPAAGNWSAEFVDQANWEAYRLRVSGKRDDAAKLRQQVVREAKQLFPAGHPLLLKYQNAYADVLIELKRLDQAEAELCAAYEGLASADADEAALQSVAARLVKLYDSWDKPQQSAVWRAKLTSP